MSFGKQAAETLAWQDQASFSVDCIRELVTAMIIAKQATMSDVERNRVEQRPAIVLTASDRERLFALLGAAPTTVNVETASFLREEIERADVAPDDIAPNSVVRLGCDVKFVDHADARIQQAQLVFPEEALRCHCISVLSPIGSALIGLGPGQSIRWTEQGRERSLAVLEVRATKDRRVAMPSKKQRDSSIANQTSGRVVTT